MGSGVLRARDFDVRTRGRRGALVELAVRGSIPRPPFGVRALDVARVSPARVSGRHPRDDPDGGTRSGGVPVPVPAAHRAVGGDRVRPRTRRRPDGTDWDDSRPPWALHVRMARGRLARGDRGVRPLFLRLRPAGAAIALSVGRHRAEPSAAPREADRVARARGCHVDRHPRVLPGDLLSDHRDGRTHLSRSARGARLLPRRPPVDRRRGRRVELERELSAGLLPPGRILLRLDGGRQRRLPAPHRGGELVPHHLRDVPHRATARGTTPWPARGGPRGQRALVCVVRVPGDPGDDAHHVRRARVPRPAQGDQSQASELRDCERHLAWRRGPHFVPGAVLRPPGRRALCDRGPPPLGSPASSVPPIRAADAPAHPARGGSRRERAVRAQLGPAWRPAVSLLSRPVLESLPIPDDDGLRRDGVAERRPRPRLVRPHRRFVLGLPLPVRHPSVLRAAEPRLRRPGVPHPARGKDPPKG